MAADIDQAESDLYTKVDEASYYEIDLRTPTIDNDDKFVMCSEWYDSPSQFYDRWKRTGEVRFRDWATSIEEGGNMHSLLSVPQGGAAASPGGHTGWRAYILGAIKHWLEPTFTTTYKNKARQVAINIGTLSSFSNVNVMKTWSGWGGTAPAFVIYTREMSFTFQHYYQTHKHALVADTADRDFVRDSALAELLDTYLPWFQTAATTLTDTQLSNPPYLDSFGVSIFLPFMVSHAMRVLLPYHDDQTVDFGRKSEIRTLAISLADAMWDKAFVIDGGREGLYYTPQQPTQTSRTDLNIFNSHLWSWVYKETGEQRHRDRALTLITQGTQHSFQPGTNPVTMQVVSTTTPKILNQNTITIEETFANLRAGDSTAAMLSAAKLGMKGYNPSVFKTLAGGLVLESAALGMKAVSPSVKTLPFVGDPCSDISWTLPARGRQTIKV